MIRDKIESIIELNHPPKVVWQAITTPEGINQWFSTRVFSTFEEGASIKFEWDELGETTGSIEVIEPTTCFAYRWRAHNVSEETPMNSSNSTLVTFELSPTKSGTQLRVVETGFLQLRPELQDISYRENTSGWEHELAELVAFMLEQ